MVKEKLDRLTRESLNLYSYPVEKLTGRFKEGYIVIDPAIIEPRNKYLITFKLNYLNNGFIIIKLNELMYLDDSLDQLGRTSVRCEVMSGHIPLYFKMYNYCWWVIEKNI